jgi:hypothetical protein
MNNSNLSELNRPTQEEIALRAHQLWLQQGCPHGHDVDNWLEAERQLHSEYANNWSEPTERAIPAAEDVRMPLSNSPHAAFAADAPLATKVEEQLLDPGRPASRRSKTSVEL